ncbi:MAG: rRNA maturation RNase YbeY [Chloroflexi bacterium]|nr:rRNA maturation RNase YbeY [Chloroflexota bacterium]
MPPYRVHVHIHKSCAGEAGAALLRGAVRAALRQGSAPAPAELSVLLTTDEALQALNRDFLGHDAPTDVLSFPSGELPRPGALPGSVEGDALYLGDIAISLPRARAQAQAAGHSLPSELRLLAVHGVLHLLGHDHDTPERKQAMWAAQAAILQELGMPGGDW